jgi:predicted nucleotide-binding protein
MNVDEVQSLLEKTGLVVEKRERTPNDKAWQLRCKTGEGICIYDTGALVPEGKNQDRLREILGLSKGASTGVKVEAERLVSRRVFVVYGHDGTARTQLEAMLRRWNLEPLILDQLPSEGQTLIEKLEQYTSDDVGFGIVLATPDDEGHARDRGGDKKFRVRQNVVLELGLLLSKLGRARVAILMKRQDNMEKPSDIDGLIYIPFVDDVEDGKVTLGKEMQQQRIKIDWARL